MKYLINQFDDNYRLAVNWDGTDYYNCPMTITVAGKLFILGAGTADRLTVKQDKKLFYIVGENRGLDYISLQVIDLSDNSSQDCYLSGNDLNDPDCMSYNLLEKSTRKQIKILCEYLPY